MDFVESSFMRPRVGSLLGSREHGRESVQFSCKLAATESGKVSGIGREACDCQ